MKYGINAIDSRSEVPWEEKSIYVFYVDLAAGEFLFSSYKSFSQSLLQKFLSIKSLIYRFLFYLNLRFLQISHLLSLLFPNSNILRATTQHLTRRLFNLQIFHLKMS